MNKLHLVASSSNEDEPGYKQLSNPTMGCSTSEKKILLLIRMHTLQNAKKANVTKYTDAKGILSGT